MCDTSDQNTGQDIQSEMENYGISRLQCDHPNTWCQGACYDGRVFGTMLDLNGAYCHSSGRIYFYGDCLHPDVDCEGSWSTCGADCADKVYTVATPQSGTGSACEAADGDTATCAPGEGDCPANVDCAGTWSDCTSACEREWTETAAQSGDGEACPDAPDCSPGEGDCPGRGSSGGGSSGGGSYDSGFTWKHILGGTLFVFIFLIIMSFVEKKNIIKNKIKK